MRQSEKQEVENLQKTAAVVAGVNILLSPLYFVSGKLGVAVSVLATYLVLHGANEIGKEKRPVQNAVDKGLGFFDANKPVENAVDNTVTGGATIFDEVHKALTTK